MAVTEIKYGRSATPTISWNIKSNNYGPRLIKIADADFMAVTEIKYGRSATPTISWNIKSNNYGPRLIKIADAGFNSFDDENPATEPALYQYLEDGAWNILMKMPRGYMVPIPRVGRRHIHEVKRQNMIPQPRIGRELDIKEELAEVLYEMQNFLLNSDYQYPNPSESKMKGKLPSGTYDDIIAKYVKNLPSENIAYVHEDSVKEDHDNSHLIQDDSTKAVQKTIENSKSGFDFYDEEKNQVVLPLPRVGTARHSTVLDERDLSGGLMTYPRLGRQIKELARTLIPYPRAGRFIDPESLDYEVLLNADYGSPEVDYFFTKSLLGNQPVVRKRKNLKLIPRIGRKKRSIPEDQDDKQQHDEEDEISKSEEEKSTWSNLDDIDDDLLLTANKKSMRSKSGFSPRIGKKRSDLLEEYLEGKRAVAFTPRIGRAALIPRIGRSDPRFRLRSRAAFVPRIGRRAALIPRVGRSENS